MNKVLGHNLTEEQRQLLRLTASSDLDVMRKHRAALAAVLQGAFRAAVLEGDSLGSIFQRIVLAPGADGRFPLSFLAPGDEEDRVAFVMPKEGAIPNRLIEGDEVWVPTYVLANSIDWALRYSRDARWDVVAAAMDTFRYGFVRRLNDDGWHTLISALVANGRVVDAAAAAGVLTKRLLTSLLVGIKRLAGGRESKVTDVFLSPEALADIRNWAAAELDETSRREVFTGTDPGGLPRIFGMNLHELQELGDGQRYQDYIEATTGGNKSSWFSSDQEFIVGLDLTQRPQYPFIMPIREDLAVFDDESKHRSAQMGIYGWMECGFAVMDARYGLIGTL